MTAEQTVRSGNGIYFTRLDDGSVCVRITESWVPESPVIAETVVDVNSWASAVAAVSLHGDTADAFWAIMEFHAGKPFASADQLREADSIIQQHYEKDADFLKAVERRFPEWFAGEMTKCAQAARLQPVGVQ